MTQDLIVDITPITASKMDCLSRDVKFYMVGKPRKAIKCYLKIFHRKWFIFPSYLNIKYIMKESDDKFQDATLAKNSTSAGEKENSRLTSQDVGIATNNENSDKVDKVRELLGQRMTPEERERKRKELIEKQKEARQRAGRTKEVQLNEENTNVADTNAIQPTQPRENLILSAIKFLSSPQVRNADEDKKVKFLLSKGLTQVEIDIAKNRVDKEVFHIIPFFWRSAILAIL